MEMRRSQQANPSDVQCSHFDYDDIYREDDMHCRSRGRQVKSDSQGKKEM